MAKLTLTRKKNMFGTTVTLANKDKSFTQEIAKNLDFDPLALMDKTITTGFMFRCPDVPDREWVQMFETLRNIEGPFLISADLDKTDERNPKVTAWIKFKEKTDTAIFAWSNVENWQKWSDAQEAEAIKEAKEYAKAKKNPQKVKLNADGTVTVKATVTTLGKI